MQIPVPIVPRRSRRLRAALALLAALVLAAALSAAAAARPSGSHRSSCPARHARHGAAKRCANHHGRKTHGAAKKTKKPARKPAPAPALTPAECEDGTAPVRSAGAYSCEDGSEPSCEGGSDPIRPSAASAPMCRVPKEETEQECSAAGGGCEVELACEDAEEAVTAPQGCEHGSAFEEPADEES
jgi:hypothetical protein